MTPYYQDKWGTIYYGDCREILPQLDKASAIVTDPPYELGFMGKSWDSKGVSFQSETWGIVREACLSGAPLLSFGGTRTFHRIACAIEDAGWEYRDTAMWVYGSGFPKSLDVSKAIDSDFCREKLTKKLGRKPTKDELKAEWARFRKVIGLRVNGAGNKPHGNSFDDDNYEWKKIHPITSSATPEAQLWEGYGTGLKPAYEPIILAMNPLDGTFANNALKHGVAGLNIDECRIGTQTETHSGRPNIENNRVGAIKGYAQGTENTKHNYGRFPANFIHDGSQMVMELFPQTSTHKGIYRNNSRFDPKSKGWGYESNKLGYVPSIGDNGSAARFFYCAKASKAERDRGLEGLEARQYSYDGRNKPIENPYQRNNSVARNNHPTVKPLALMTYLVKLVRMPEYNLITDPFCGSGTTLLACIRLGIPCIGIDNDEKSCEIAAKRCCQEVMELV